MSSSTDFGKSLFVSFPPSVRLKTAKIKSVKLEKSKSKSRFQHFNKPEVLVHDGVVVALDGHLLEVVVAIVAAEHRGRALRVDRCLHEVGARVFEVLWSCAQAGGISDHLMKLPHESSVKVLESCAQTFSYLVFQAIRMTKNVNLAIKVTFPVVAWSSLSLSLTGLQNIDRNLVVSDHNNYHHLSPHQQSTWSVRVRYKPTKLKPKWRSSIAFELWSTSFELTVPTDRLSAYKWPSTI